MNPNAALKVAVIFAAVAIAAGAAGCHKKHSAAPAGTAYSFTIAGNTLAGFQVTFQSTAQSGSAVAWRFGDGGTASGLQAGHVYSTADSFTVVMTVNNNAAEAASQTIYIAPPPNAANLDSLPGIKYWHGYVIADYQSDTSKDTLSSLTEQFTIAMLNSVTMVAEDDTLSCYYTDTVNKVYYYHHVFGTYSWREIAYYYASNTCFYMYQPDQGGDPVHGPYSSATVLWAP